MSNDAMDTVRMPAFSPRTAVAGAASRNVAAVPEAGKAAEVMATSQQVANAEAVKAAASQIESYLKSSGRELEFRVDEGSGQMVVSVRDAASGDLIRQIPGEAVLRMARALKESKPSLVDTTV